VTGTPGHRVHPREEVYHPSTTLIISHTDIALILGLLPQGLQGDIMTINTSPEGGAPNLAASAGAGAQEETGITTGPALALPAMSDATIIEQDDTVIHLYTLTTASDCATRV
jgi:hypothetical protein